MEKQENEISIFSWDWWKKHNASAILISTFINMGLCLGGYYYVRYKADLYWDRLQYTNQEVQNIKEHVRELEKRQISDLESRANGSVKGISATRTPTPVKRAILSPTRAATPSVTLSPTLKP